MIWHKSAPQRQTNWAVDVKVFPTALWLPLRSDLPPKEIGQRAAIKILGEGKSKDDLEKLARVISEHTEDCRRRQAWKAVPVEAMTAEARKRDRSARVIRAPAGTAVRAQPSATDLSFYFPVPGSGGWLLLAFSGPDGPLSPVMAELFDAIAATLRWAG
jgi:hypothetical protein